MFRARYMYWYNFVRWNYVWEFLAVQLSSTFIQIQLRISSSWSYIAHAKLEKHWADHSTQVTSEVTCFMCFLRLKVLQKWSPFRAEVTSRAPAPIVENFQCTMLHFKRRMRSTPIDMKARYSFVNSVFHIFSCTLVKQCHMQVYSGHR